MSDASVRVKENGYNIMPQRLAVFYALVDKEPQSILNYSHKSKAHLIKPACIGQFGFLSVSELLTALRLV